MEVELLKQIAKNTEHKTSFQIIVSDNKPSFNTRFNPKLELDRDKVYEIALVNLETYYSFPNIDETNNVFGYSPDNGNSWVKIESPVNLVYLPLTMDTIDSLNVSITDQDDHLLNLRKEKLTIRFHIREAR